MIPMTPFSDIKDTVYNHIDELDHPELLWYTTGLRKCITLCAAPYSINKTIRIIEFDDVIVITYRSSIRIILPCMVELANFGPHNIYSLI
jgi:hypothetical protein